MCVLGLQVSLRTNVFVTEDLNGPRCRKEFTTSLLTELCGSEAGVKPQPYRTHVRVPHKAEVFNLPNTASHKQFLMGW